MKKLTSFNLKFSSAETLFIDSVYPDHSDYTSLLNFQIALCKITERYANFKELFKCEYVKGSGEITVYPMTIEDFIEEEFELWEESSSISKTLDIGGIIQNNTTEFQPTEDSILEWHERSLFKIEQSKIVANKIMSHIIMLKAMIKIGRLKSVNL